MDNDALMGFVFAIPTLLVIFGLMFWFIEDPKPKQKLRAKRRQKKIDKGILKSDAYIQGYRDMGMALYDAGYYSYYGGNDFVKFSEHYLRKMSKNYNEFFDPQSGRTTNGYLSGTAKEFEDYYAGGMQLLDDVDSAQARLLEEEAVIEQRRLGLQQFDRQTIEAKRELDKLRNKAYNIQSEHENFDRILRSAQPKKSIWRPSKKEVA